MQINFGKMAFEENRTFHTLSMFSFDLETEYHLRIRTLMCLDSQSNIMQMETSNLGSIFIKNHYPFKNFRLPDFDEERSY